MSRSIFLLFFFLLLYLFSVGTDPILGDSLVFTVVAAKDFDLATNATNYFLYINSLAVLHKIINFINPHNLFAGFSILCSIFTLYFLRKFLFLFDLKKNTVDILILVFGFSFTFWRISIITEVYSFYLFIMVLFLYQFFLFIKDGKIKNFYWASVLFGLLFIIHIQTLLLVPFYLYFLYDNFKHQKKQILAGLIIPAIIFSILLIPVIQDKHSFAAIFTDNAWGDSFLQFKLMAFLKSLTRNAGFLVYNFLFFIYFLITGVKKLPHGKYFIIAVFPYVFFILKHDVSDSYVFHLVPYLFLIVIMGKGLERFQFKRSYLVPLSIPLIYFLAFKMINYTKIGESINAETGFKGGTRYFLFPPLKGNPDLTEFINAYDKDQLTNKSSYSRQYQFAKEWVLNKNNF